MYSYENLTNECDCFASEIKSGRCLVFCLCQNSKGSLVDYISCINKRILPLLLDVHLRNIVVW